MTNTQIDRELRHLDERIQAVLQPLSRNDRAALLTVMKLANSKRADQRADVFDHFSRKLSRQHMREAVERLHIAYDEAAADEATKSEAFDRWLASVKSGSATQISEHQSEKI